MRHLSSTEIKAVLAFVLVAITVVMLFVSVADGAEEIRAMFVLLTGIVVYDFIRSVQEDKRIEDIQEAYDPTPPPSHVRGEEQDTEILRR